MKNGKKKYVNDLIESGLNTHMYLTKLKLSRDKIIDNKAPRETRTLNLLITNQLRCQLCYRSIVDHIGLEPMVDRL